MSLLKTVAPTIEDLELAKEIVGAFVFSGADGDATLGDARLAYYQIADALALLRLTGYSIIRPPRPAPHPLAEPDIGRMRVG